MPKAPRPVVFDPTGLSFLFTGKLATLTRAAAQKRVKAIGGRPAASVGKALDVLVIGDDGSPLFGAGTKGSKQQAAEALIAKGAAIRIISETSFLGLTAPGAEAVPMIPTALPKVALVGKLVDDWTPAICGMTLSGGTLYAVGGLGTSLVWKSDTGAELSAVKVSSGRGLRTILVDGTSVWIAGEYGQLYRSKKGFSGFKAVPTKASKCLFNVARSADGTIWVGGDEGFLARIPDDESVIRVTGIKGAVGTMLDTPAGLLIAANSGIYLVPSGGAKPKRLGLAKKVRDLIVTRAGTIMAVGGGNAVYRSTDSGKTFKTAKVPAFAKTKVKRALTKIWWVPPSKDLNVITELSDGRVIVGGDGGTILSSSDDGQSFRRVPHALTDGSLWAASTFRGAGYLGGENSALIRVT